MIESGITGSFVATVSSRLSDWLAITISDRGVSAINDNNHRSCGPDQRDSYAPVHTLWSRKWYNSGSPSIGVHS